MNKILMSIVVEYALFLESTDEKMLDPDLAISKLEELSYFLKQLEQGDSDVFRKFVDEQAQSEKDKYPSSPLRAVFLEKLCYNLGI